MAKVCIICEKEPRGRAQAVADDVVVSGIRAVKKKLGIARNNELYVCEQCLPAYREKRKKFEKNLVFYIAASVLVFVFINALQLFGQFNIAVFVASLFLPLLILGLVVINYEIPPLKDKSAYAAPKEPEDEETQEAKPAKKKPAPSRK